MFCAVKDVIDCVKFNDLQYSGRVTGTVELL